MKIVILAGGVGTRLWPISRKNKPKQFNAFLGDLTLIEETFRRLKKRFNAEDIYVSTSANYESSVKELLPNLSGRIIVEPSKRDTAPAMGFVASYLEKIAPNEEMLFVASDQFIANEDRFLDCLELGAKLVREKGKLVDIGIKPESPDVNFGYTKIGTQIGEENGIRYFELAGFTEKPNLETAKAYLNSENYLWHANNYMWTPSAMMSAYDNYAPEISEGLRRIQVSDNEKEIFDIYDSLPAISIDYALMEKLPASEVVIIEGDYGWNDIGNFTSLHAVQADKGDLVKHGNVISIDSSNSLIYASCEKLIATIGIDDLVIADTEDALLVCRKGEASRVKEIIKELESNKEYDRYL